MKKTIQKDEPYIIEDVILSRATHEEIEKFKNTFPDFQICGQHFEVYLPQYKKTIRMTALYKFGTKVIICAQKTKQGVIVAYECAWNTQENMLIAFGRIDNPR